MIHHNGIWFQYLKKYRWLPVVISSVLIHILVLVIVVAPFSFHFFPPLYHHLRLRPVNVGDHRCFNLFLFTRLYEASTKGSQTVIVTVFLAVSIRVPTLPLFTYSSSLTNCMHI